MNDKELDHKDWEPQLHTGDGNLARPKPMYSLGDQLRTAREDRGITIEQVAVDLHVDRRFIYAIEDDNFALIGKKVFIRGYVKNYAKYLELDVDLVLTQLDPFITDINQETRMPDFLDRSTSSRDHLDYGKAQLNFGSSHAKKGSNKLGVIFAGFTFLLLLGAVVGAFMFFEDKELGLNIVEIEPPVTNATLSGIERQGEVVLPSPVLQQQERRNLLAGEQDLPSADNSASAVRDDLPPSDRLIEPGDAVSAVTQAEVPSESSDASEIEGTQSAVEAVEEQIGQTPSSVADETPTPAELSSAQPAVGERLLQFQLAEKCWIEVRTTNGDVVVSKLFQAQQNPEFRVTLPVDVVVGNASAANITLDGTLLEMESYVSSNVARFRIPR